MKNIQSINMEVKFNEYYERMYAMDNDHFYNMFDEKSVSSSMVERETSGENTTESERNRFPIKAGIGVRFSADTPDFCKDWTVDHEKEYEIINWFNQWIENNLKSVLTKENAEDLTEDERFSLAYSAGAKFNWFMVDGKFKGQTEPCGIIKDGDKWVVLTKDGGWITK